MLVMAADTICKEAVASSLQNQQLEKVDEQMESKRK